MNHHQVEAVANANAHLSNAVLPTYVELVAALALAERKLTEGHEREVVVGFPMMPVSVDAEIAQVRAVLAKALQEEFVVVNASGLFYTEAGNATWSSDEALAQKFDLKSDAEIVASLESGSVLPVGLVVV